MNQLSYIKSPQPSTQIELNASITKIACFLSANMAAVEACKPSTIMSQQQHHNMGNKPLKFRPKFHQHCHSGLYVWRYSECMEV